MISRKEYEALQAEKAKIEAELKEYRLRKAQLILEDHGDQCFCSHCHWAAAQLDPWWDFSKRDFSNG